MEKFKSFEDMSDTIKHMDEKWSKATEGKDTARTYAGAHQHLSQLNSFLNNERNDLNSKLRKLGETYSQKVVNNQREKLTAEYNATASKLIEAARTEIKELTASKREKMGEMLTTPPTAEQLRLLEVLKMRSDIDMVEIHNVLPMFFDNYHAMRVLQAVGESNGITVKLPVQLDPRAMFEGVEKAHSYLMGACELLGTKWSEIPTQYRAFFTVNDKEPRACYDPHYNELVEIFDSVPQLQEIKTEKTQLTATEAEKIALYFKPVEGVNAGDPVEDIKILKHTQTVMSEHPEDLELLKLSKYGNYVREIEENATRHSESGEGSEE